jgi:hypothetical protein
MAWDWVGPVATATVGVVAIATNLRIARTTSATQLQSAREERAHSSQRLNEDTRSAAYCAFLTELGEYERVAMQAMYELAEVRKPVEAHRRAKVERSAEPGDEVKWTYDPGTLAVKTKEIMSALARFDTFYEGMSLSCSPDTYDALLALRDDMLDVAKKVLEGRGETRFVRAHLRYTLLNAMRADLGREPIVRPASSLGAVD